MQKKRILLLGAGHANIQVLHQLAKVDRSLFELTLVSDRALSSYSGMIPSFLAGDYQQSQLQFDLNNICNRFNFSFVEDEVLLIKPAENQVRVANGAIHQYDICSVNIGIKPKGILTDPSVQTDIFYLKPISDLILKWHQIITKIQKPTDVTIIGGGAAAFEIAIACRRHFEDFNIKIKIITGNSKLLSNENDLARAHALRCLDRLNIAVIEGQRVEKIEAKHVVLSDGRLLPRQICFVSTSAEAPAVFKNSNLPVNEFGFIKVDQNLKVLGSKNIFAAGDCSEFTPRSLPKAGVYAVREGPVLFKNIISLVKNDTKLVAYSPQRNFLKIYVSGRKQAIASYKNFCIQGRLAWQLKDYIDKTFMKRFQ